MQDAASISTSLGLAEIEPLSVLISLNQRYTDELVSYFNLCGVRSEDFYSGVVGMVNAYPGNQYGSHRMRLSDASVEALNIALGIEANVGEMAYPNSALVTGLLMADGPLRQYATDLGITKAAMQDIVTTGERKLFFNPETLRMEMWDNAPRRPGDRPMRTMDLSRTHVDGGEDDPDPDDPDEADTSGVVGLDEEIRQIDEYISAARKLRERGSEVQLECDTLIIGPTGTGKNFLAECFTGKLYEAGLIRRQKPVVIDAVNWRIFEEKIGQNLESIADGVLVVDNAQKLVKKDDVNNIGTLDSLFSAMENIEKRPVVMLLGLPEGMDDFLSKNPSVGRKFEYKFRLNGYNAQELARICEKSLLQKFGEPINGACRNRLTNIFKYLLRNRPADWAYAHTAEKKADSIYMAFSMSGKREISPENIFGEEDHDVTVEEILAKLDDFVGIDKIRDEILGMVAEIENDRERFGGAPSIRSHFVFTGNPGTGKTTIARVFADVLKALKVLPIGQLIEADRSQLVSGYVGQTAIRTNEVIDKAIGGVLFIDEAYTLATDAESGSGFGKEAIDTLLKRLEDDRGKFVCIVAGYTKEMYDFIHSNPGLESRFNKVIEFDDYDGPQLAEIFRRLVAKNHFTLDNGASENIDNFFNDLHSGRTRNFGNAREVRNIFDEAKKRQSRRLTELRGRGEYSRDKAFVFTREDIEGSECNRALSLEDVIARMDEEFVGMQTVKDTIRMIGMTMAANRRRVEAGISDPKKMGIHIILTGNPGTGKTTVARSLGKVLRAIRILPTDKVTEVDKSTMVGQYVGSTPKKVNELVDRAMGGILFIDEAYTLSQDSNSGNSFGKEAIETLMKRMEDDRGKFVCVMAGYRSLMDEFVRVNPGIDSRVTHRIHIEDYTADELEEIFLRMVAKQNMNIDDDARRKLHRAIEDMVTVKTKDFGNARDVRKLFDETLVRQSLRIQSLPVTVPPRELSLIKAEDIPVEVAKEIDERECLEKLDALVGLEGVKREIRNLTQYLRMEKMRSEVLGKKFAGVKDHYLFLGNPGTGKTTVARILGEIFLSLGICKNTSFVETDRSALVAGYVGQTAPLTNRVIDSALGGILFIDEAYSLMQGPHDSFGQEAIDTLLKRMEDDRGKFVCIAAGYSREMQQFIDSNSGLRSRFNKVIKFEDYDEDELVEIFRRKIVAENFIILPEAEPAMRDMVRKRMSRCDSNFGNAREINTLFQHVKERQSNRLYQMMSSGTTPAKSELLTLIADDFSPLIS